MSIKLIVTDLDGTFLQTYHSLNEENVRAVRRAREQGVYVAAVTARNWSACKWAVTQTGFDPLCVINNGAAIVDTKTETLCFENGKSTSSRVFKELFYGHTVLRPSCYECPYKSVIHPGDITIADYWGIEKAAPEFDDNKGVSLVLVNNEAGEKNFEKVKKRLIWKQTKLEDSMQPPLKAPFPKPDNREQFWSDFENKSFEYVAKKYGGIGLKNDAKLLLRKIKRKIKKLVVKGGKRDSNII